MSSTSTHMRAIPIVLAVLLVTSILAGTARAELASDSDKKALAQTLRQLMDRADTLAPKELCAKLNPPFMRAREYLAQAPHETLRGAYQQALSLRSIKGCLIKCPEHNLDCGDDPEFAWKWHNTLKQLVETCRKPPPNNRTAPAGAKQPAECADPDGLSLAFRLNFLMLVRRLPPGDARLEQALADVMITVGPSAALDEVLRGVDGGKYNEVDVANLVKKGMSSSSAALFTRLFVEEMQSMLERSGDTPLNPDDVWPLIGAAIRVAGKGIAGAENKKLSEAISSLSSNEAVRRLLEADRLLRGNQAEVVFASLQLLAKQDQAYVSQLTKEQREVLGSNQVPSEEIIKSLVHAVNHVQMAELHRLSQELVRGAYVEPQYRRYRLLIVLRMPPGCEGAVQDHACTVAAEFGSAILSVVNWGSLWGMQSTDVKANLEDTLVLTESALKGKVTKGDCDQELFGSLCTEMPYAGVLFIEFDKSSSPGSSGVTARASWRVRYVNDVLSKADGVTHSQAASSGSEALLEGGNFGRSILRQTGVATPTNWFVGNGLSEPPPPRRPSWRQWTALGALAAGSGTVIGGVYVNNTHPSDPAGDRLWQAGLGLLTTALAFQIWELVHD